MFKKTATELVTVHREDVQSVLRASIAKPNNDVKSAVLSIPHFNGWPEHSIQQCCILSSIKRFLPGTIIIGSSQETCNYAYFVLDGICQVTQKVTLNVRSGINNRPVFTLHKSQNISQESENVKFIFVNIYAFSMNDCFGFGEDLDNRWVVSSTPVRCLIIQREFLFRHNRNNIWNRTCEKLTNEFPVLQEIFDSLILRTKWYRYKQQLVFESLRNHNISNTRFKDVPCYWKIIREIPLELVEHRGDRINGKFVAPKRKKICKQAS